MRIEKQKGWKHIPSPKEAEVCAHTMQNWKLLLEHDGNGMYHVKNSKYIQSVIPGKIMDFLMGYDEYESVFSLTFMFKENQRQPMEIFGMKLRIVGVRMSNCVLDTESRLAYLVSQEGEEQTSVAAENIPVSLDIVQEIYDILKTEESKGKSGMLKNHTLSEEPLFCEYGVDESEYRIVCGRCGSGFYDMDDLDCLVKITEGNGVVTVERYDAQKTYPENHEKYGGCWECLSSDFLVDLSK